MKQTTRATHKQEKDTNGIAGALKRGRASSIVIPPSRFDIFVQVNSRRTSLKATTCQIEEPQEHQEPHMAAAALRENTMELGEHDRIRGEHGAFPWPWVCIWCNGRETRGLIPLSIKTSAVDRS
jgi:hypothetical protein